MSQKLNIYKMLLASIAALILLTSGSGMAANKASIAVLPLRLNAPTGMDYLKGAYIDIVSSRIGSTEGIDIMDPIIIQGVVEKYGASAWSEEIKKSIAKDTGASFLLLGSLSIIGDDLSLDVKLIKTEGWNVHPMTFKGKGVGSFTDMLDKVGFDVKGAILGNDVIKTKEDLPASAKERVASNKDTGWKSQKLPLALKGIKVADLNNDGVLELVAIDDKNLYIYAVEKNSLKLIKEFKGIGQSFNYNIAVGDFNGNGLPEIYLTRTYMDKASTRVIEFTGKEFVVTSDDLSWFIKSVKVADKTLLVGEKFRPIDGLYGGVKLLKWSNGNLLEEAILDMPKWMDIYGFTICDSTGDGKDDFLYLDENDRLRIYEKDESGVWKQTWRSTGYYGGSTNNIDLGGAPAEQKTINIKADILCGRPSEDAGREIITISNDAASRVFKNINYESGETRGLLWNEFGLQDIWRTQKINGYVADFVMADVNNDGIDEIVELVVTKQPSIFSAGESLIVALFPQKLFH